MSNKLPRDSPSDDQLKKIAEQHLSWEVLCLLDSLGYIKEPYISTRMSIGELWEYRQTSNAKRRQFNHPISMHDTTIHTRVIASFLKCESPCTNGKHKNDVEAGDYIVNWPGLNTLETEKNWEIFNKSVAHLSLDRLSLPVMRVNERKRLAIETLKGLKRFIGQLPKERAIWFADISKVFNTIDF